MEEVGPRLALSYLPGLLQPTSQGAWWVWGVGGKGVVTSRAQGSPLVSVVPRGPPYPFFGHLCHMVNFTKV